MLNLGELIEIDTEYGSRFTLSLEWTFFLLG